MRHYQFTVLLEPDLEEPHRYNVRVPTLPGCLTYGESIEDALANAREAITGYLAVLIKSGAAVPIEDHPVIATSVAIPASAISAPASDAVGAARETRS
jgi:antitoxin HicB